MENEFKVSVQISESWLLQCWLGLDSRVRFTHACLGGKGQGGGLEECHDQLIMPAGELDAPYPHLFIVQ